MLKEIMKKLICLDIDGTLLSHTTYRITDEVLKTLEQLKANGNIVAIASGRDLQNSFSSFLNDLLHPEAIVHCNGQKVTVGEKKLQEIFMEKSLLEELIPFAENNGLCIGVNIGPDSCFVHPEIVVERETRIFGSCDRTFVSAEALLQHPLYALAMYGTPEQAALVEEYFPKLRLPLFAGGEGADIIYRHISKADGIQVLLDYYGMDWKDVIAFGDSSNDMEMIQAAGMGIAMGNAVESVKKVADYITKTVDEDGVVYGVRKMGLL